MLGSLLGLLSLKRYVEKDTYPETTEEEIQELTDKYVAKVDHILELKEVDIMKV